MTPVQAAKELGIRPQIVYGYLKHNRLPAYPNPSGHTQLVDVRDVKNLSDKTQHHRPKDPLTGAPIKVRAQVSPGTLLSYHAEVKTKIPRTRKPHRVVVVTEIVKSEDDEASLIYTTRGEASPIVWETEELAKAIANGTCHIESPDKLLGALMYHWVHTESPDLAMALQVWCEANEVTFTVLEEAKPFQEGDLTQ